MKPTFFKTLLLLLTIWGCSPEAELTTSTSYKTIIPEASIAVGGNDMDILDYYLDLPDHYFLCDNMKLKATEEYRLKSITQQNVGEGYLKAHTGAYPLEMSLFRDESAGKDIISVVINCGNDCLCNEIDFFTWSESNGWETEDVFPYSRVGEFDYTLSVSSSGKAFNIINNSRKVIGSAEWSKGSFNIKKRF